jgi:hypothetical protein
MYPALVLLLSTLFTRHRTALFIVTTRNNTSHTGKKILTGLFFYSNAGPTGKKEYRLND